MKNSARTSGKKSPRRWPANFGPVVSLKRWSAASRWPATFWLAIFHGELTTAMNCRTKSTASSSFPQPLLPVAGAPIATAIAYVVTGIIPSHIPARTLHPSSRNPNPIVATPAIISIHPLGIKIGDWSHRSSLITDGWDIVINDILARSIDRHRRIECVK